MKPAAALLWRAAPVLALAAFAAVGLAIFDDYGVGRDEWTQRYVGETALAFYSGGEFEARFHNQRFYGAAFELPLALAERALGLEDARDILLSRRLLTHLFFLIGGAFVWLLARRMFDSRPLALAAMLIFLLQPRIYAHSFFNSKDPVFLSMFAIALYAIHRAFRRDSLAAFAVCGAAVGLLVGVRILGFALFAAVIAMRGADFVSAALRGEGKTRAALSAAAFALAAIPTALLSMPLLLGEPLSFFDGFGELSRHPTILINQLFMGEIVDSGDNPRFYTHVWMAITTPPIALALAVLGVGAVLWSGARRPFGGLANSELRFRLLLAACLILTLAALAAIKPVAIEDWRHAYFLHAPICLLAVCGLDALARAARRLAGERRLLAGILGKRAPASAAVAAASISAIAALGIGLTAFETASIHPFQYVYFNRFVDRDAPEYLRTRYDMSYWGISNLQALEFLLDEYPDGPVKVKTHWSPTEHSMRILPKEDRERVMRYEFPDFYVTHYREHFQTGVLYSEPFAPALLEFRVYGNTIMSVLALNPAHAGDGALAAYREIRRETLAGGAPVIRSEWDVYSRDGALIYLKDACGESDIQGRFELTVNPAFGAESKMARRGDAPADLSFIFEQYGVRFDGVCMMRRPMPDYPVAGIETGRRILHVPGGTVWRESAFLPPDDAAAERYAREYRRVSESGELLARADFDVYLTDGGAALHWLKSPCGPEDARGRFLLTFAPRDAADMPAELRALGHERESRNFTFVAHGARFNGMCMARRDLPDYPIREIALGQWIPGGETRWSAIAYMPDAYRELYADVEANGEPIVRSDFDVYLRDGALRWLKSPCDPEDARGRFQLSVFPRNAADLPAELRALGRDRESLDFNFAEQGAFLDGTCMARVDLPDYPIWAAALGQWTPGGETLWSEKAYMADAYRGMYAEAEAGGDPLIRSDFDVYLREDDNTLHWLKSPCADGDTRGRFLLSVFPQDAADLPAELRDLGHESLNFTFANQGALLDGTCMARVNLPDYPIRAIAAGQWILGGETLWFAKAETPDAYRERYAAAKANGEAVVRSDFDVYLLDNALHWLKSPCADGDARGRFLLSVFPRDAADLPAEFRDLGHESLNFEFAAHGSLADGSCMARRELPDYPIRAIEVGQWIPGGETLWSAKVNMPNR